MAVNLLNMNVNLLNMNVGGFIEYEWKIIE